MPSRQALWQQKQRAVGKCPKCGNEPAPGKTLCDYHLRANAAMQRKYDAKRRKKTLDLSLQSGV